MTSQASSGVSFSLKARPADKVGRVAAQLNQAKTGRDDSADGGREQLIEVNVDSGFKVEGGAAKKKEPLVIPCRSNRNVLTARRSAAPRDEASAPQQIKDDVTLQAEQELLNEANRDEELSIANGSASGENSRIELVSGSETDGERARMATLDDYDSVPVEGFGMGMLRGMGFKEAEGIGGFKKVAVKCIEPALRPKGLGLGAAKPCDQQKVTKKASNDDEEELQMKTGAYVKVVKGQDQLYGQVEGVDHDSVRVFVKMAVGGGVKSVSAYAVQLVTKKEYKKYSKVINRELYDKYREEQDLREMKWSGSRDSRDGHDDKKKKRQRSRSRSRSPPKKSSRSAPAQSQSSKRARRWVHPHLRVRFIDKHYKDGRYFKQKMVITDVPTASMCVLRAESGRILDDIPQDSLETLVPKDTGSLVMILKGELQGQLAEVLDRDRKKYEVVVRTVPDRDQVTALDFDDVCEYVGDELSMS